MPPRKKVTKDFLKEVFAGRKHLIPRAQLRPIEVPKYDELSVVGLVTDIMKEKELGKILSRPAHQGRPAGPPVLLQRGEHLRP